MSERPAALGQVKVQRTSPTFWSGWRKREQDSNPMHSNSTTASAKSQVPVSPEQGSSETRLEGAGGPTKHRKGARLEKEPDLPPGEASQGAQTGQG